MKVDFRGTHNLLGNTRVFNHGINEGCPAELKDDKQFQFLVNIGQAKIIDETTAPEAPAVDVAALQGSIEAGELKIAELELKAEADAAIISELSFDLSAAAEKAKEDAAKIAELEAALKKALKK